MLLFSSCSFKFYRATIGNSSNNISYRSVTSDEDGKEHTSNLCVRKVRGNLRDAEVCDSGGFKRDFGVTFFDPWLELYPLYFGKSSFGWSYFFALNDSNNILLNYPFEGEATRIDIGRASVNPYLFYNFGDRYISNDKGLSFRFGVGLAVNYIYRFEMKRLASDEVFDDTDPVKTGGAVFTEVNWRFLTLRVEQSEVHFDGTKFTGTRNDSLRVSNTKSSLLISYYFK